MQGKGGGGGHLQSEPEKAPLKVLGIMFPAEGSSQAKRTMEISRKSPTN